MRALFPTPLRAPHGAEAGGTATLDTLCINTIRTLSMDGVQKANSGHPGTAMALAPVAYTLWQDVLNYDPADPLWPNRDRFVLSIGHASMLIYSLIYLAGVRQVTQGKVTNAPALTLEDLQQFRQFDSKTPGHPEYGHTTGVETTTGPLGQGCGNSVGMAMAEKWLAARYNKPGFELFNHHVYTLCGDGDMMEGISGEAASTAGHLKLGNLVWMYDANRISIEGSTDIALTENVAERFAAYGWQVLELADANDTAALKDLLAQAKADTTRPTFILVRSVIAWGAPTKAGTAAAHGEPLGDAEIQATKKAYGWPEDKSFYVPEGVQAHMQDGLGARGAKARAEWEKLFASYRAQYPEQAAELDAIFSGTLPEGWDSAIPTYEASEKGIASRASSGEVLNAVASKLPWLLGGSADLAPSTKTLLKGEESFQPKEWNGSYAGRNFHFGVREHAMGAIVNGMALYGLRPFCAGFLIFSDYMKAPIRLAALMQQPVTYIFTHDSIGVGEDGPTHQPIEQLVQLRATPGMTTIRPGDANEVAEAWRFLIAKQDGPVALALSRQNLPTLDRNRYAPASGVAKGAYVLADSKETPKVILIASGSELSLAVSAYEALSADGIPARVVSMPSWELFEAQPQSYRDNVLPPAITGRVVIEAASAIGWDRYAGLTGDIIAMRGFGASAPAAKLMTKFGFTPEAVLEAARRQAG
ncbi:transketolase [Acetobacter cibinongensis]|uniref:Transketolase n=1 Tax=Acetobacter cibinongensis TaxID=146475 RepID=A0A0D6N4A3_9PROT|nr:transketolase [Acetobacter cibinongensis]GAN60341.1 transketolase [Acetobacter cibinongensis]GBQ18796.1 transketolase [Acetobacter cibinongensis NRIC 0482]GEL58045.1 transketolase [Acetobacter cibinongensis]